MRWKNVRVPLLLGPRGGSLGGGGGGGLRTGPFRQWLGSARSWRLAWQLKLRLFLLLQGSPEGDRSKHSSFAGFRSRLSPDHFLVKLYIAIKCYSVRGDRCVCIKPPCNLPVGASMMDVRPSLVSKFWDPNPPTIAPCMVRRPRRVGKLHTRVLGSPVASIVDATASHHHQRLVCSRL